MYWIIESVNSLVFMFCVFILLKMQKKGMISTFLYFFFFGGLTSLFILYSKNLCSYYDLLEFNADMIKNVVGLGFGVNVILLIIFLSIHIWVKQTKKSEIAVVHNIRILPFCSVQYVMVIIGIIFSLLCFIDHIMPQYGLWTVDNHNIQLEKYGYHITNVTQNEYGYPLWMIDDYPLDLDALEDKKKIMIIGDSFIWGDGCSNSNYLWWRQLQRKINEDGYRNCTIIGIGKCGASTQNQLDYLKNTNLIDDIKPDMILIGYVTNDAQYQNQEGNLVPKQLEETDYFANRFEHWIRPIFPNITYLIYQYLNDRYYHTEYFNEKTGYPYEQWELEIIRGAYLERYKKETVDPLGEFAKSLDIPVILVATPSIPSMQYYEERYDSVLPLFEDAGISVYNPLKKYVDVYEEDEHYADGINIVNSHPGTATNMFLAEYVKNLLENDYKEYLGEKMEPKDTLIVVNDWFPHAVMPQQKGEEIHFTYPASIEKSRFLYMPIGESYIKLCFEPPINISEIKICGELLESESGEVYATYEDSESGYDSQELKKLGDFDIKNQTISIELTDITSLCIHVNIKDQFDRSFSAVIK